MARYTNSQSRPPNHARPYSQIFNYYNNDIINIANPKVVADGTFLALNLLLNTQI